MKRSSSPENDDSPARKRLHASFKRYEEERKQFCKQVDTSGTVIWSGTVKIPDSQKTVFDCSIKAHTQDEGIKSLFSLKQLTICIVPSSAVLSLHPHMYKEQSGWLNLRTDENTDMMSYSAFCQAIRLGSNMVGFTVLKNSASTLHLLFVASLPSGLEDYIIGNIITYQANDTVLGILRSHGLLSCANPGHEELVKQITRLKEELQYKDKKLTEQQKLNQELVERHENEMEEKERKHEEERNMMAEQITERERTITTMDRKIKDVQHEKEEMVNNLYLEFQCSICQDTMIEASCLPSCRHMFCKFCIGQWLKEETKCPLCKQEAGIPVPYIGFDKAIDTAIGHFGKEAKQARIDAVKNREAFIEIKHERSFLVSSEESEGQSATSQGESVTSDGESVTSEGESVTSDGESVTSEGESVTSDGESVTSEGESMPSLGRSMTSEEEERVPEHSGRVSELYPPRESLTDSSDEESLSQAQEGKRLRRKQEETRTAAFLSTLPTSRPLSPSSSEDEPTLS